MNDAEYQNMFLHERDHFFYRYTHDVVLQLAPLLRLPPRPKILDVGCGTGLLVKKMKKIGIPIGIDAHPNAIRFGKRRGIQIRRGTLQSLPFKARSFDMVTCIDVLCHRSIENDVQSLRELRRVMKPGSSLLLRVPAHQFLYGSHDRYVHTKYRYSLNQLRRLLTRAGFSIPYITYMNAALFIPSLLKKAQELLLPTPDTSTVRTLPRWLNSVVYSVLKLEIALLKRKVTIPFGIEVFAVCHKPSR